MPRGGSHQDLDWRNVRGLPATPLEGVILSGETAGDHDETRRRRGLVVTAMVEA